MTCEVHPFFFQVKESRRTHVLPLVRFSGDDINEPIYLYKDNEQEEVDPKALEREVESDEEEEWTDDEDEEDDEDDRYGTWRTYWEGVHLCRPKVYVDRVCLPDYAGCPDDRVCLPDYAGCPDDRVRLPDYVDCPGDRVCLLPSSVIFPIPITTRGKIDPGSASRYITSLVHGHIPGPVDS
ncbi:hypothetical protein Taro_016094 [Colocasia esculenta]|uniref:Uncharacterized protein n=1 Tax=Colocasia esculenta TaxID=4460 RepID=A0A843URY7_COLES|nr:hypothetical protein [Colocasia esculenta]